MKLEKYKQRNSKKIGIAIFTITCVLLIAFVFIYSSFASFQTNETRSFINGNVVDPGDLYFAFYVDGVISSTMPAKGEGYVLDKEKTTCTNGATVEWLNDEWAPKINNLTQTRTKCTLYFKPASSLKERGCGGTCEDTTRVFQDKYIDNTTKIAFQNTMNPPSNYVEVFDESEEDDGSVKAYVVENADTAGTYTIYFQTDGTFYLPSDSSYYFAYFLNVTNIEGLEYVNTSRTTKMHSMFYDLRKLEKLDVSHFDTTNVTDMSYMFANDQTTANAPILKELDLSNFDTSNVSYMSSMFRGQRNMTSLNVSSFDTTNVTDMSYMFAYMNDLISLNVTNFNTSKVTDMEYMFHQCQSLSVLDLSNFDTSDVTNMHYMFGNSYRLTELNISNFDTSKVTDMEYMFYGTEIPILDLSHFDTTKVTSMAGMFREIGSTTIDVSSFDTSKVKNMSQMFLDATKLTTLDVSSFDTSSVTSFGDMFAGTKNLTNIVYGPKFIYQNNAGLTGHGGRMFENSPANRPPDSSWAGLDLG